MRTTGRTGSIVLGAAGVMLSCVGTVLTGIGGPRTAEAATTITVDALVDESPPVANGNCTLREAVQAANTDLAVDGCAAGSGADTIAVPSGTLIVTDQIMVTSSVTFSGANAGIDARNTVARVAPSAIQFVPPVQRYQMGIFTVTCSVATCPTPVVFDGLDLSASTAFTDLDAIVDYTGSNGPGAVVRNSVFQGFTLALYPSGTAPLIEQNVFTNNNRDGAAAGNGIYTDLVSSGAIVRGNLFVGQQNAGVLFDGTPSNGSVSTNVTVTGNQFIDGTGLAILLSNVTGAAITGNYVDEAGIRGITVASTSDVTISDNSITGNIGSATATGILVRQAYLDTNPPNSNVTISGNRVSGNSIGLEVRAGGYAGPAGSLDAGGNWWGANGGPGSTGGSGAVVNGIVDSDGALSVPGWITIACPTMPTVAAGSSFELTVPTGAGGTIPWIVDADVWYPNTTGRVGDPAVRFTSLDPAVAAVSPAAVVAVGGSATATVSGVASGTAAIQIDLDAERLACAQAVEPPVATTSTTTPVTVAPADSTTSTTTMVAVTTTAHEVLTPPSTVLPSTGGGGGAIPAAAFLLAGAGLVLIARRRRDVIQQDQR